MIVPMLRLNLLCPAGDKDIALAVMGQLGVVHLTPVSQADATQARAPLKGSGTGSGRGAVGQDAISAALTRVEGVLEQLPASPGTGVTRGTPTALLEKAVSLFERCRRLNDRLAALAQEHEMLAPLGQFDVETLQELRSAGLHLTLYFVPKKTPLPCEAVERDATWQEVARMPEGSWQVLVGLAPPPELALTPVPWPQRSLKEVDRQQLATQRQLDHVYDELMTISTQRAALVAYADDLRAALRWTDAAEGMALLDAGTPLAQLQGYVPEDVAETVHTAAASQGWAALLSQPDVTPDSQPPTLLRYPKWLAPIQTVFEAMAILPGYKEADIGGVFLVFLSLFFAMLVGDAGYGLLFLGLSFLGRWKIKALPGRAFTLLTIMSVATIVWGTLTGTWFGAVRLPAVLEGVRIDWLTGEGSDDNLMLLCFTIGAIQLSIAHLWNILRLWPSLQCFAQMGWLGVTWGMYYAARFMVLLEPFPTTMLYVLGISILLIVLFMTPVARLKDLWFQHVMLPLNLISNFVDVVSYVRLFAVGAASLAMAQAVNDMALGAGVSGIFSGLLAAGILFVGHAGNILLASMGVLVHGVRLNTLEFANHMELTWAGRPYAPFTEKAKPKAASIPKADTV